VSLKYIMLGMLREPHSGYDIGKQFEQSLKNFWKAELSHIYPLLKKM
jgi:DNA-binding PadR family transcriptional regulator